MNLVAAAALPPPTAGWLFEVVGGLVSGALLIWTIVETIKHREIPRLGLIFIAASSMFWQEFFIDWGVLLLYNPAFASFPGWTSTWHQTPNKPIAVLFGYGYFFVLGLPFAMWGARRIDEARPSWNRFVVQGVVAFGLFFAFDILAELVMSTLNWYRYFNPASPTITVGDASMSLVHPTILFMLWAVGATLVLAFPDAQGLYWHERLARVDRLTGWKREAVRVVAWVVLFNGLLFVTQFVPGVLGRILFGSDNPVVPY